MRRIFATRAGDAAVIALLFLLPLIAFWAQTMGGRTLLPTENLYQYEPYATYREVVRAPELPHNALLSDLVLQNMQFKSFIRQQIAQGEFPLWNPHQFSGIAFFAAGQQSTLYPFSLLFYVLPLAVAYGWFTVIQLWLAGVFLFLFLRGLGVSRAGAAAGGVIYQLSATMIASAVFPMILAAAAWLPLILLMIELIIRRQTIRARSADALWGAIGAGALGCVLLAGHAEFVIYTLLVAAFYTAARLIRLLIMGGRLRHVITRGLTVTALTALGIGLGAVQFLPLYEAANQNYRTQTPTLGQVLAWAHPPRDVLLFFMPNVYGNPAHHSYTDVFTGEQIALIDYERYAINGERLLTIDWGEKNYVEGALYVGILPLMLSAYAMIAAWRRRDNTRQHILIFALLGVIALSFMFGLPTYAILYYGVPGMAQLHSPFRWVFVLTLCLAVLAGFGLDALLRADLARLKRWIGGGLIAAGALIIGGLIVARFTFDTIAPHIDSALRSLARADRAFSDAAMFFSYQAPNVAILGALLVAAGVVFLIAARRRALPILAILVIAADLLIATWGFNPASDPALLDFTPPAIEWLQAREGDFRYTVIDDGRAVFNANLTMRYGLDDVRGYESIIPLAYVDYMRATAPQPQLEYNRIAPLYVDQLDHVDWDRLALLNVCYIVTPQYMNLPAVFTEPRAAVYQDEAVVIWTNQCAPRAFVSAALDADTPLIVDADATITQQTSRERWIDVRLDAPALLVISETYADGWRAYVRPEGADDDAERAIPITPRTIFPTIALEAGDHTVRMVYSPASFQIGAFVSFISGVIIAFMLGVWLWLLLVARTAGGSSVIARNSAAPILLNLFNRAIDFAFAFIMLRILGPTDAGLYFYAGVVFVWFDIFSNFGLNLYLTREVARDRSQARHLFVNTSAMRIGLALIGVPLLIAFLTARNLTVDPPLDATALVAIGLLYLGLLPNSLSTGMTALFYAFERAETPAAVTTVATINKAALGLLVLIAGWGIVGLAAVSIVTNLLTFAILMWAGRAMIARNSPTQRRALDLPLMRRMTGASFPLMLNHFLATIFFQIDVVIIEAIHGARMVGQYSVAYKWISALNVIPAFFTQALLPVMSRQAQNDRDALKRTYTLAIKLLVAVALPVAVVFTFMAEALTALLGGAQYLPDSAIATQLMIWSIPIGWINSVTQYVLIALDLQNRITRAFVIAVGFNIIANLIFVPQFGYRAAAITTIASEAVLLIPFAVLLHGALGRIDWIGVIVRPVIAGGAMLGVLLLGWNAQPLIALVIGGLVYAGVLAALRPFTSEEWARLPFSGAIARALPARTRAL